MHDKRELVKLLFYRNTTWRERFRKKGVQNDGYVKKNAYFCKMNR